MEGLSQNAEIVRRVKVCRLESLQRQWLPVRHPLNASWQLLILLTCWSLRHLGALRPPGCSLQADNNHMGMQDPQLRHICKPGQRHTCWSGKIFGLDSWTYRLVRREESLEELTEFLHVVRELQLTSCSRLCCRVFWQQVYFYKKKSSNYWLL